VRRECEILIAHHTSRGTPTWASLDSRPTRTTPSYIIMSFLACVHFSSSQSLHSLFCVLGRDDVTLSNFKNVRRECEILRHISGHPNVHPWIEAYEDENHIHIVLELCSGGMLYLQHHCQRPLQRTGKTQSTFPVYSTQKVLTVSATVPLESVYWHPNVASLIEAYEDENHIHIVLELCSGVMLYEDTLLPMGTTACPLAGQTKHFA